MPSNTSIAQISLVPASADQDIQALLYNVKWGGALGTAAAVSYSFPEWTSSSTPTFLGFSGSYSSLNEPSGATVYGLNAAQQAAAALAMQAWANVADITYSQVADTSTACGDVRFAFTSVPNGYSAAWAYEPGSYLGGDVWLTTGYMGGLADWSVGTYAFEVLVHELGHTLGLKHSFEGPVTLPTALDNRGYTVMSYTDAPHATAIVVAANGLGWHTQVINPDGPMIGDIAAIQYLYGANKTYHAGDDVYTFDPKTPFLHTIWDAGGNDTISVANFTAGCTIDLRPGHFSSLMMPSASGAGLTLPSSLAGQTYDGTNNLGIAYGTVIENAVGGAGNDTVIGNDADNTITGGAGNDTIDGGGGINTACYSGSRASYTVSVQAGITTVHDQRGTDGTDSLTNIQRLHFADKSIAIDMSGSAGNVAKILGAVFGPQAVYAPSLVGLGLKFADKGMSFDQLMNLALANSSLGAAPTDKAVVDLLYTNVVGVAPSADVEKSLVSLLAAHTYDQVGLAVMAAGTAENASRVNLVGLASNGLEYVPVA